MSTTATPPARVKRALPPLMALTEGAAERHPQVKLRQARRLWPPYGELKVATQHHDEEGCQVDQETIEPPVPI